jgi:hypothetical protein
MYENVQTVFQKTKQTIGRKCVKARTITLVLDGSRPTKYEIIASNLDKLVTLQAFCQMSNIWVTAEQQLIKRICHFANTFLSSLGVSLWAFIFIIYFRLQ